MIDMAPGWAAENRGMKLFDFSISSGRCKWPVSLLPFVVALSYCSSFPFILSVWSAVIIEYTNVPISFWLQFLPGFPLFVGSGDHIETRSADPL
jgi:hypothetical protein